MEQIRSNSIASSSCSLDPLPAVEYEVFLSFRGPDVRTTFANFLHKFLNGKKIRTFFDDEALRKGEETDGSLAKAIGESRIYIPILSKGYASSKWCLNELALMVQHCKKDEGRHTILPIFYLIEPRDVRHCTGSYEEAMEQQSEKYDEETIEAWKEALNAVGQIKGWSVNESDGQGTVAELVYSRVWPLVHENYKLVTNELIGIDSHVNQVIELLKLESGINIVGIHGMGGIGKTTIAKAVHDKVITQFDRRCFLENAGEILSSQNDGITTLQSKIIFSILGEDCKLRSAGEGINIIKNRVCPCKVLIILDDVDDRFEFEQILGEVRNFSHESRFIITTRDKRVLDLLQVSKFYEPEGMSHDHSLQLLLRHAFRMDKPREDRETLCEKFVKAAAGLPLTLEVIGSLLFRTDLESWEDNLRKLEGIPPSKVQERLKISYDTLDANEKKIFLDIACFFVGINKEYPFYMWKNCEFYPGSGIRTLILRSLIKLDEGNVFWMHDHLRDLGRKIVHEEDDQHPWKRTRIWSNEDAVDMLRNGEGTERLEVLRVNMADENFELTENKFLKLSGLRYLEVYFGRLIGDFKKNLRNLSWLSLYDCRSIPTDFNMKKLVILSMKGCPVGDDWRGWDRIKDEHRLKVISLSSCDNVTKVPDLFGCTSLEHVHFRACWKLGGELHIGSFKDLRVLKLGYTKIIKLTGDIGRLQNLQEIRVEHSGLREIPASIGKLSSLKILDLKEMDIVVPELPTSLKWLTLSLTSPGVPNLSELKDLEWLSWTCYALDFSANWWKLSKLKNLTLKLLYEESVNPNYQYPYSPRRGMIALISSSASLPSSLNTLSISGSRFQHLERLPNLVNLRNLRNLFLEYIGAHKIVGLGELSMLQKFHLSNAPNLINLDGLEHLELLKTLTVSDCDVLRKLPSLSNLIMLRELQILYCPLLSEIQGLGRLASLSYLKIHGCYRLTRVTGLDKLESLQALKINYCTSIEWLHDLSALEHLRELNSEGCNQLTEMMGIDKLESLQELVVTECAIEELPDLSALVLLQKLNISECNELTEVKGLDKLHSLRILRITDCASIKKLPDLSAFKHLQELTITGCNQLTEVTGIERLEGSRYLTIDERLKTSETMVQSEHERLEPLHRDNNSRPKIWSRILSCWGVCLKDSDMEWL
ncbi:unnamed protein product [Linum trigynum]|uniref:TIR domain-containing protein n=1 Tax=Linum trigynum TaxID=586398 RepID=A0AAV2CSM1_9ROSI